MRYPEIRKRLRETTADLLAEGAKQKQIIRWCFEMVTTYRYLKAHASDEIRGTDESSEGSGNGITAVNELES